MDFKNLINKVSGRDLKGINLIGADIVEMDPYLDHSQAYLRSLHLS